MKFKTLLLFSALTSAVCMQSQDKKTTNMNPFFDNYSTPFEVPPFHLIKNEHFKPALLEGIKQQEAEIEAITSNKKKPTFENTILAMEESGELLSKVRTVFSNLNSANTNPEIQAIAKELAPNLSAHSDNINLNQALFARVKNIWDNQKNLKLNQEQAKILENLYTNFVRSGANLSEENKKRVREINSEMAIATLKYGQNILAETNSFELVISDKNDLAGLPNALIENAAADAKARNKEGKWVFTLSNSSVMPFLQYSENRALRAKIYNNRILPRTWRRRKFQLQGRSINLIYFDGNNFF